MIRRTFLRAVLWAAAAVATMAHHRPDHQVPPGHQPPDEPDPEPGPEPPPTGTLSGDYPEGIHLTDQDAEIVGLVTTPGNVIFD